MTRQEQKQARRQDILLKAMELFVTKGYHETKISDIAKSVPMSVGLLFHYFESKEQLLLELVALGAENAKRSEQLGQLPPEQYFDTLLSGLFAFAADQPWVFRMFVLMGQAGREGMPEKARALAGSVDQIDFSAAVIRKGQATGVFRAGDPTALATCFWAGLQGVMEQMAQDRTFQPDPAWLTAMLKS